VTKGIKITLTSSKLFKSLSADLNPEADPILVQIGGIIRTSTLMNIYSQERWQPLLERIRRGEDTLNIEIRAEGHTDDKQIPMNSNFRNNWELSSARALNLVQRLSELAEMDQHYFSALGYGEFRPKVNINNIKDRALLEEARAQNRRVEIYFDAFIKSKNEILENI
jgi:chemotaxis protein MotB